MKRYKNNAWTDIPCYIFETSSEIVSPPTEIIADGQPLSNWKIKGNLLQGSTPSPQSPIYPQETGDLVASGEHAGQYKLPITSGNTTIPLYLSEPLRKIGEYADEVGKTETTRKIYKWVLTGDEPWYTASGGFFIGTISPDYMRGKDLILAYCTHYQSFPQTYSITLVPDKSVSFAYGVTQRLYLQDSSFSDVNALQTYLRNQYANGTPVTVWYVLATPTSESIEAPTIPTVRGSNTFDVLTTLKPSEMELTYKGWHDATVKEWDGSEWQ